MLNYSLFLTIENQRLLNIGCSKKLYQLILYKNGKNMSVVIYTQFWNMTRQNLYIYIINTYHRWYRTTV